MNDKKHELFHLKHNTPLSHGKCRKKNSAVERQTNEYTRVQSKRASTVSLNDGVAGVVSPIAL
jgi:hypothetical protein